jgi:hypothetical protein
MNSYRIASVAQLLTDNAAPREIPGSEECKNRIEVALRVRVGGGVQSKTVDAVYVDAEGLLLVWRWHRIDGATEDFRARGA